MAAIIKNPLKHRYGYRSKILKCFLNSIAQKSTAVDISEKKIEHYRNLSELEKNAENAEEWNTALPFDAIPGPKPLPLIGNTWRHLLRIGNFYGLDFLDIHKTLHEEYGDIAILKGILGRQPLVLLFNPEDIKKFHKQEGIWPIRRGFPSIRKYRQIRKDLLPRGGLLTLEGEEWFKFRSLMNPILMKPKNIIQYTGKVNNVTDELIDNMRYFSLQNERGEMPDDFEYELYKWTLETIVVVMMDTHLGCLKRNTDKSSEPQKLMHSILEIFDATYHLDVMPGLWRFIETPRWKSFVKNMDFVVHTSLKHVNHRLDLLRKGEIEETEGEIESILLQLVKLDKDVAKTWPAEMILAGVDTTAKTFAAALYFISKNREAQEKLKSEATSLLQNKNSPVTKEILVKALYTKAVVKETTRLAPIIVGNLRCTPKNLVFGGYQIPAGTHVQTSNLLLCRKDENFPRASEFLPERWLSTTTGELSYKNSNHSLRAPFGVGPRGCIGRRLATLELELALLKIVRNFDLKWPHEDMIFQTHSMHGIAKPLKLHIQEL